MNNDEKVLVKLRAYVKMCGSQKEAAHRLGLSAQYISDLMKGRRRVSESIANKFGFTAMWVSYSEVQRHLTNVCTTDQPTADGEQAQKSPKVPSKESVSFKPAGR
jgi:DNA-binding transcriptional regulator YdaS (Cro superfamily)